MAHNLGYARISTADQDPQLQLDALAVVHCLKIYTDIASGTKADRPQWQACLADLRPGDTLMAQFSRAWPSPQGSGGQTGNRVMASL